MDFNHKTPKQAINQQTPKSAKNAPTSKRRISTDPVEVSLSPLSPDRSEAKKKRKCKEPNLDTPNTKVRVLRNAKLPKRKVYYKKVSYDGGEFSVGDDVYVKRREDASSDDEDPEIEECRVCFKAGRAIMIECDDCLGGFHLKCLKPPLKTVPEGDWICGFCEAKKLGKKVELPIPKGKKLVRTAKEKLLSSDLWASHIERYMIYIYLLLL